MPYGSILADTLQSSVTGTPPVFTDGNGTQVGTLCRAWVNFDGTTSPGTIKASFNVSSVTKNSTGIYTINFSTTMPDANYTFASYATGINAATYGSFMSRATTSETKTTSACRVATIKLLGGANQEPYDVSDLGIAFFR